MELPKPNYYITNTIWLEARNEVFGIPVMHHEKYIYIADGKLQSALTKISSFQDILSIVLFEI